MFASVWQLLTAIFVFSALTKLVYKLIKQEDPRANSVHSSQRGAGGGGAAAVAGRRAQQQQQDQAGDWYNLVHFDQQPGLVAAGGQPNEFLAAPSDVEQRDEQDDEEEEREVSEEERERVQELTDEDDEFEEALSQVFSSQASSPLSREREQEERRLRWLTRQQFRRQLHRLSNSAAASSLELRSSRRSSSSSEYLDACSSSSSSSSRLSLNQQQQQVAGRFNGVDKNGGDTQGTTTNKRTLWPGQGNATSAAGGCDSSSIVVNQSEASSSYSNQQINQQRAGSYLLSNLSQLIAEVFLIEPLKLTCTIVRQTFKHFCAFLDFIEGIEPPLTEEQLTGRPGARSTAGATPAPPRGQSATGGRGQRNPSASTLASNFRDQQAQRTGGNLPTTKRSHPNYFHRRYFSQRSLSAALLSDNPTGTVDRRPQQAGPAAQTRPLV